MPITLPNKFAPTLLSRWQANLMATVSDWLAKEEMMTPSTTCAQTSVFEADSAGDESITMWSYV